MYLVAAVLTQGRSEELQGRVGQVNPEIALASSLLQKGLQRWHPLGSEVSDDQVTDALQIHPLLERIHCSQRSCQRYP